MDELVVVHAQNINQSRGQDPFVQPLYLTRPESRISGIEERDSLSLLLGYREDLLCEIRSLQILVPVENTDKVRFGYDLLVLLCQLLGAKLGQRPRVADHDVDTPARVLSLKRQGPRHCSRCPDVRKVYTLEKVLEYCLAKLVCLNNRNDLTAKLRKLSHHIRRVSSPPDSVSPAQKISSSPLSHLEEGGRQILKLARIC